MGLELKDFTNTKKFKSIAKKINQESFYEQNNSHPKIMELIELGSKSFGESMQRIVAELLGMEKAKSTGHDAQKNGKLIEIKSSRYWVDTKDWCFQHIMEDHKYDYLLCVGIAFDNIELYIIDKEELFELKHDGLVRLQGGGEGQGMWFQFKDMKDYLHRIESVEDFDNWIK